MADKKPAFRLQPEGEELIVRAWPVEVNVPADGGHEAQILTIDFLVLDNSELEREFGSETALFVDAEKMDGFLARVVRGFPDLTRDTRGGDPEPVPFSDAVRDAVLARGYVRNAVITAYLAMIAGRVEKNSVRRPG